MALDHIGRGPKDAIAAAIAAGELSKGDLILTTGRSSSDTKGNELLMVDQDDTAKVITPRTQADISVLGVNLSTAIADGKTIPAGTSIDEFIKMLVQKQVPPTYSAPTVSLVNNGGHAAGNVEVGETVSIKLRSTFTKKDAGALTNHQIKRGSTVVSGSTSTSNPLDYTESLIAVSGATTYTSVATYGQGPLKQDNFGQDYPTGRIAAGSKTSSGFTITGCRKAFWGSKSGDLGTVNSALIRALGSNKLNPAANDVLSLTVAAGQKHIIVALPSGRTLKQVTYVDVGDKSMLSSFTQSTVKVADARGGSNGLVDYKVYVYSMSSPAPSSMNFEFLLS